MRALTVIALLSGLALFPSEAVCREARAAGTITRLDAETCRVEVTFTWVGEGPIFPTSTCNYDYQIVPAADGISLNGPFGTPEQMGETVGSFYDGHVFWFALYLSSAAFNFKPASTQTDIAISFYVSQDWNIESYYCDQPDPCPQLCSSGFGSFAGRTSKGDTSSGTVYAELPQGIGEFTVLREIPVAVRDRTWSQVKSIFRD